MDPNKEPTMMTNAAKAERDSEIKGDSLSTPSDAQVGQGDMDVLFSRPENPFQNTSHLQQQRETQPVLDVRPGRSGEPVPESLSCAGGSCQSLSSAKINSNGKPNDSATPSCSKSSLNTNEDLSINKVEGDKEDLSHTVQQPSTTSSQASDKDNSRENRKRPSSLKLNRPNVDDDSSSMSDYSLGSEDGCIYTYRGGEHLADLPSSFFSLDMGLPADRLALPNYAAPQGAGNGREGSRASSPDMDFLEMDFDPGPSNEVDSGEESTMDIDLDAAMDMPEEKEPMRAPTPKKTETCNKPGVSGCQSGSHNDPNSDRPSTSHGANCNRPSTSRGVTSSSNPKLAESLPHIVYGPYISHINARGDTILVRRTMSHSVVPVNIHRFNGELILRLPPEFFQDPSDSRLLDYSGNYPISQQNPTVHQLNYNPSLPVSVFHIMKAQALITEKKAYKDGHSSDDSSSEPVPSTTQSVANALCVEPPRSMIWSEETACEKQVTQIGTSACGATAVVNAFNALGVPVDIERINTSVGTRGRANTATLPSYLLSRAVAGSTAADMINGMQIASGGLVTGRFFPTYPERAISLSHFLSDWISLGAVPILTLNLQNGIEHQPPDAWHHQMVFGVSELGVCLCNPLECVRENVLWPRLVSPSVLLVRVRDIYSRFRANTDVTPLMYVPDARFHTMNVFGQVVNVIRESRMPWRQDSNPRTEHIRIPAAYQAGITIAVLTGTEAHRRLMVADQLPLLDSRCSDQDPV